ncbi:MAG: DUF6062 family protein [Oscillospiraceae bacterium]|jgi:hypothetical protein|nr:DUF6062 family protein [Oscillospiraceae bacterium]
METIYTIPLNEAFDEGTGCPFCRLTDKLKEDTLEYTLGAAMMEPSVRVEMNRLGFCRTHFAELAKRKNKLALALILETRFAELLTKGEGALSDGCFVCGKINNVEAHYLSNAANMFSKDPAFAAKAAKQEYFCLTHTKALLTYAKKELKRKQYDALRETIFSVESKYLAQLKVDARKFADSFDYRNSSEKPGDERFVFDKATQVM